MAADVTQNDPATFEDTGIFSGVPYEEYERWPGLRKTRLWTAHIKTAEHYKWELDNQEIQERQCLLRGRALHVGILEPDRFERIYVPPPKPPEGAEKWDKRLKAHKAAWAIWHTECEKQGYVELPLKEYEKVCRMRDRVWAHKTARHLLEGAQQTETSLHWHDDFTGLLMKCREDAFNTGVQLDVKGCRCAATNPFGRDAYRYGYHFQSAIYHDARRQVWDGQLGEFVFIAVESEPPYCVKCHQIDPEDIELGRQQYRITLQHIQWCMKHDEWPGYPDDIDALVLPSYAGTELGSLHIQ